VGISVAPSVAIAVAVSYLQPVFAVQVDVRVEPAYQYAVAQLEYRYVQVTAEVTFPDRLVVDIINPIDLISKTLSKPQTDVIAPPSDQLVFDFEKVSSDSFTMEDDVDIDYWLEKLLGDTQGFTDLAAKSFVKAPITDSFGYTDQTDLAVDKSLQDSAQVTEALAKTTDKALADSFSPADLIQTTLVYIRTFADSLAPIDAYALSIDPNNADSAVTSDLTTFGVDKALSDDYGFADAATLSTAKPLVDSLAQADLAALNPNKGISDSYGFTDTISPQAAKGLSDQFSGIDALAFAVSLAKADSLLTIDDMDGDLTYAFVKLRSEVLATSDTQVVDTSSEKTDNLLADDAGSLVAQNYCDITYFAEDYVGESRTFT
jgi:hypothetical protein